MEFQITGIVREKESKRPVPGLLVRAFDEELPLSSQSRLVEEGT